MIKKRNKTDKNRLVKRYWENISDSDYKHVLDSHSHGTGIYVLYNKNKIYYIGLSKFSLRNRIRKHFRLDRHKRKWDTFSFYQIGRIKFIKDIETLLLRIIKPKPKGNQVSGKFNKRYNLKYKYSETIET